MAVITESKVRALLKTLEDHTFLIEPGDILTPSARQYLTDQKVKILTKAQADAEKRKMEKNSQSADTEVKKLEPASPTDVSASGSPLFAYTDYETGAQYLEKPEFMTQIKGNQLVVKNHSRIVLRGKIDLLLSHVILEITALRSIGYFQVSQELREVFDWIKIIQRCEILDEPLPKMTFLGMDQETQKHVSHNPQLHYNTPHLFGIDENTAYIAVRLNVLRAEARTLELTAIDAYYDHGRVQRLDLLTAFNRLSSCIYIMMLRAVAGQYDNSNDQQESIKG